MNILYLLLGLLCLIAVNKLFQTWKLAAEVINQKPNFIVRSYFKSQDFVADLVVLKVFK